MNITAVIIDDMPSAVELLSEDLRAGHPEVDIIGTASSVVEGALLLNKINPDVLFLDIMLGDGTGFDLLEICPNLTAKIIFVTASDQFAIRAFKFAAIDYILKPFSSDDLSSALDKAIGQIKQSPESLELLKSTITNPSDKPTKITLSTQEKMIVVDLHDIRRCQSDNNCTMFYLKSGNRILVTKTLKYYSTLLTDCGFIRVHQSHLVNTMHIKEFVKQDGGYLVLDNDEHVPVSHRKRAEVAEALKA